MSNDEAVPGIPDAVFRRVDQLPSELPESIQIGPQVQAKPGALQFSAPTVGIFRASGGNLVEFALEPDADPGAVQLLLHGTGRGALIHQRGELPLHAATLVPPGGDYAIAICGASGAGKSTLGAALSRRGWALVADDTTRVTWDGTRAIAWPSRDTIKLWKDACDAAAIDTAGLERVTRNMDKYYVPVAAHGRDVPLAAIVELTPEPDTAVLSAAGRMALISRNTYRASHIRPLGMHAEHARIVARIATGCTAVTFRRDRNQPVEALAASLANAVLNAV